MKQAYTRAIFDSPRAAARRPSVNVPPAAISDPHSHHAFQEAGCSERPQRRQEGQEGRAVECEACRNWYQSFGEDFASGEADRAQAAHSTRSATGRAHGV